MFLCRTPNLICGSLHVFLPKSPIFGRFIHLASLPQIKRHSRLLLRAPTSLQTNKIYCSYEGFQSDQNQDKYNLL